MGLDIRGRWRGAAPLGLGGIRLEDNVLITDDGCEVLTRGVPFAASEGPADRPPGRPGHAAGAWNSGLRGGV